MAKILLIEDDTNLAELVRESLESVNHHVDILDNGADGLWWLQNNAYDVAIVDWGLPGLAGIDVCKRYRDQGGSIPILILTGRKELHDMVNGLDSGADDYVCKPFRIDELHARLRSLLRRVPTVKSQTARINGVEIDSSAATVKVGGTLVDLNRKQFAILELLMKNPGVLFSTDNILERAWPSDSESSPDTVRCHMTHLRKKLEEASPGSSKFIKTIYGCGYKAEVALDIAE